MKNLYLSKNLTLQEAITSQTATRLGIDNTPNERQIENLKLVATHCFQPIRDHFGKPIRVSSGFRSKALNKAIRGSATSDHPKGLALDLQGTNGIANKEIFDWAKENLDFDQLIWEYGTKKEPAWVHISYRRNSKNRRQILYIGVK